MRHIEDVVPKQVRKRDGWVLNAITPTERAALHRLDRVLHMRGRNKISESVPSARVEEEHSEGGEHSGETTTVLEGTLVSDAECFSVQHPFPASQGLHNPVQEKLFPPLMQPGKVIDCLQAAPCAVRLGAQQPLPPLHQG